MIRVLIADDEALIRAGFRMILDAEADIEVVGEAEDGREAVALSRSLAPDVVLMDVRMPEMDGITATRLILAAGTGQPRVVMLTTFDRDRHVYDAMKAGASGFLLKTMPSARLVEGVRQSLSGEVLLAPVITRRLIEHFVGRPRGDDDASRASVSALTDREREVLLELAKGRSNAEIANALFLSEATVKTYITRILGKLDLRDRVQAVVFAYANGLVD